MFAIIANTFKIITIDLLFDIVRWPVWWYSEGLKIAWDKIFTWTFGFQQRIGLSIWLKNWFRPMYGQYDWQGRIISFFFRTITIIFKVAQFLVGFSVFFILFLLYLVLPLIAIVFLVLTFFV